MQKTLLALATSAVLTACVVTPSNNPGTQSAQPTVSMSQDEILNETKRLNEFFEKRFEERLAFSPIQQTFLGRKTDQDKIDDFSTASSDAQLEFQRATVKEMQEKFDYNKLTAEAKTSWDIAVYQLKGDEAEVPFRNNQYIFEQMRAVHAFFPQLLIAFHKVENAKDMENYISRIKESSRAIDQLVGLSKLNASNGVRPPYFAFEKVISESQSIITGAPFDKSGKDSSIWENAKSKIAELEKKKVIDAAQAKKLREEAKQALIEKWEPAYKRLIVWQKEDQKNVSTEAKGVGALPNGDAYYKERLASHTTTGLTADEIHKIGLSEVARSVSAADFARSSR